MRTVLFAPLLVVLLAFASPASAVLEQTASGAHEWSGAFAFSHSAYSTDRADASVTMVAIAPGYGLFVADNVELKLNVGVLFTSWSNGNTVSQTTLGLDGQVLFHFASDGDVVPFFGGGLGVGFASDSESGDYDPTLAVPIVTGGVRIFITDSGCLTFAVTYSHQINALYTEDVSGNIFALSAGYSIFRF